MKRFFKIACNAPSKPVRLIVSTALAFAVMVFINGFIGGMGGFPAFVAFVMVFYLLRSVVSAQNRITHQLAMSSRRELGYVFVDYCVGYLVLWTLIRLGLQFSRVNGWGHINGASAVEYVRGLLDTPVLEKWAYLFSGILMFAFVLSLFPLVVLRRPGNWVTYALLDGAVFAVLCELLGAVCRVSIGEKPIAREICLIDYLLLCGNLAGWKRVLCIAGILLFALGAGTFSFLFAAYCYGPKPGRPDVDTSAWAPGEERRTAADERLFRRNLVLAAVGVFLLGGTMALVFFGPKEDGTEYEKVAEYLTEDDVLGPMVFEGRIYIPVDEELDLYESGKPLGYLARKGEKCDTRFYELTVANLLYAGDGSRMQVHGALVGSFAAAEELERAEVWKQDSVFLLWDEDWVRESAYTHEPTGYTVCGAEFVEGLERRFGQVEYRTEDFGDYDAYFSLCGYADIEHATVEELAPGHWIGCILAKDNQFYYGNRGNLISGVLLQELLDILGGYGK